ncbi:hypothetical protein PROFUN_15492 [Planoprotostelium fungivorum]|uniref:Chalcone isomerase domain-containing protein n=1 Tax=Planoprotostelium fungivorum TaxID=1890364 RepID=A0A2P6MW02_9EUKA|nr:hypothetical protein PROFUN_15492 [Planoprotostelium fungivorum]
MIANRAIISHVCSSQHHHNSFSPIRVTSKRTLSTATAPKVGRDNEPLRQTFSSALSIIKSKETVIPIGSLIIAAAALTTSAVAAQEQNSDAVSVGNTELPFSLSFEEGRVSLLCFAQRTLTPLKIKTYVMALYMDPLEAKNNLKSYHHVEPTALARDEEFFESISCDGYKRVIRIVPSRDVQPSHLYTSLFAALNHLLNSKTDKEKAADTMAQFKKIIPERRNIPTGTPVDFVMDGRGNITCYYEGKKAPGQVHSSELCWSFMQVYVGKNTKTPAIKESLANNFGDFVEYFGRK